MSLEDMERQIDRFLTVWFPWFSAAVCAVSALYFGAHMAAALIMGWI